MAPMKREALTGAATNQQAMARVLDDDEVERLVDGDEAGRVEAKKKKAAEAGGQ